MKTVGKRTILVFFVLAALSMVLTGCVESIYPKKRVVVDRPQPERSAPPSQPEQPIAEAARPTLSEAEMVRQAEQAESRGKDQEALDGYEALLKAYPGTSAADSALAAIGQIQQRRKNDKAAIAAFQKLVDKYPASRFSDEARRRLGLLYIQTGLFKQAVPVLNKLLAKSYEPKEKARLRISLGRAHLGMGNHGQALEFFLKAYHETPDATDKDEANRLVKLTIHKMSMDELNQAQTEYVRDYPGGYVAYLLAYRYYRAGQLDRARSKAEIFIESFPGHAMEGNAQELLRAIEGQGPPPPLEFPDETQAAAVSPPERKAEIEPPPTKPAAELPEPAGPLPDYSAMNIACLLPLSGSGAAQYGQQVLKGLQLAQQLYQAVTPGFKVNLIVRDSKGSPETAIKILDELAKEEKVLAVVGPLIGQVAARVAPLAEIQSVPMITLSQMADLPQSGKHIFRLNLSPRAQARAVARYAVQTLGLRRIAILHPDDRYGRAMRDFFWDETNRLSAEVTGVQGYNPAATDFSEPIRKLAGVGKVNRKVEAGKQASVPFEAVFLPDSYKAVSMIAPQFAYHDITSIRLLGTSLWYTPNLLRAAARYTQGAIFPVAFYPYSDRPEIKAFVDGYRADVGDLNAVPGQYEAYGFDAALLLLALMDRHHVSTREALVHSLSSLSEGFPGVTGSFTFSPEGEYIGDPTLLTIEGSEFKPVD
ncbi:MAG: penicillin-binding protein activator [Proteobacteria bacterium]|nr:penicillin-binding protein activator [Pseudomonadota bacterium]